MKRSLSCECGFSIEAPDLDDLIDAAKHHARHAHRMALSREQLVALTKELDDETQEGRG